jgi:hypothetical protein
MCHPDRDHSSCFRCLCSKVWFTAFAYILRVCFWVNCLVSDVPSFTLLSQFLLCEFEVKFLSLLFIAVILQLLTIHIKGQVPTAGFPSISLSMSHLFSSNTSILFLANCFPDPFMHIHIFDTLGWNFVRAGTALSWLFRSSGKLWCQGLSLPYCGLCVLSLINLNTWWN